MLSLPSLEFHVRVVTILTWMSQKCKTRILCMAAVLICFHSGQRPFYLLTAISQPFFSPVKPVSFLKLEKSWSLKRRLLSDLTSEGHSYWLDSLDKLSSRRSKLKDMEGTIAIAKSKEKPPDFLFSLQYQYSPKYSLWFCKCFSVECSKGKNVSHKSSLIMYLHSNA